MIEAIIRHKAGSRERSEDLLTSAAFGLLRYLPAKDFLLRFLNCAQHVALKDDLIVIDDKEAGPVVPYDVADAEIEFWPWWDEHGQPDLAIRLLDQNRACVKVIAVEVKLDSGKSGSGDDEEESAVAEGEEDAAVQREGDQLVKYWEGLTSWSSKWPGADKWIIYLTADAAPPIDELAVSLKRSKDRNLGMTLSWLSWIDLWRVLHRDSNHAPSPRPADDLLRLLDHLNLRGFEGFRGDSGDSADIHESSGFWYDCWFSQRDFIGEKFPQRGFWSHI